MGRCEHVPVRYYGLYGAIRTEYVLRLGCNNSPVLQWCGGTGTTRSDSRSTILAARRKIVKDLRRGIWIISVELPRKAKSRRLTTNSGSTATTKYWINHVVCSQLRAGTTMYGYGNVTSDAWPVLAFERFFTQQPWLALALPGRFTSSISPLSLHLQRKHPELTNNTRGLLLP